MVDWRMFVADCLVFITSGSVRSEIVKSHKLNTDKKAEI